MASKENISNTYNLSIYFLKKNSRRWGAVRKERQPI